MMRGKILANLFMMATAIVAEIQPAEIRLRLLNPWSGKPIVGQPVILFEAKGDLVGPLEKSQLLKEIRAKTGPDGVAVFVLAEHLPDRILFDVGPMRTCPDKGNPTASNGFYPQRIINFGLVVADGCVPKNWHGKFRWQDINARPGEVIIFCSRPMAGQW